MKHFDVIVIGGGHAGCEAAHASARMGAKTALVTFSSSDLGVMSCNPAIGGLGKGHLVREIDALDGIMGRAADYAGIQYRLLNRRKGPAVQGPRIQADRLRYKAIIRRMITAHENIQVIEAEVTDLVVERGQASGIKLFGGEKLFSDAVIVTSGTFLRGRIHIGDRSNPGGRIGSCQSSRLADRMKDLDLQIGRLKTGTPPRLDGRSINWDLLEPQYGDDDPTFLSFYSKAVQCPQVACRITHTNVETHEIVKQNISSSAMYGGHIEGNGPRYCPSIEDKVVRFGDKDSHQVFLEPEDLTGRVIYPNGISTSLPMDVQTNYVRSMKGLERAILVQPGYAVEYDFVDPRSLDKSLMVGELPGLFLAGQINGTTGYEEAASQGLVAGLNAALLSKGKEPVVFSRTDSYIGVLVDDLTSRGVTEPYRMFTSRAEFRLHLRADNADQRLTPRGLEIGCVSERRATVFRNKVEELELGRKVLNELAMSPSQWQKRGFDVKEDGQRRTLFQLLSFPGVTCFDLEKVDSRISAMAPDIRQQLEREALYQNYIARQRLDIERLKRDESMSIPQGFDFLSLDGLSSELKEKLVASRPSDLAQVARIEGMTPSAISLLYAAIKKSEKRLA